MVHVVTAIVSMCVNTLYPGGSAPPPPPGKFFNLQPLRWFLVAPETNTQFGLLEHVPN